MSSSVRLAFATLAVTIVGLTTPVTAVRQQPPADRVLPDFDAREGRQPQPPSPQAEAEIQRARGNGRPQVPVHPFTGGVLVLERPGVNVPRAMAGPALRNVVASLANRLGLENDDLASLELQRDYFTQSNGLRTVTFGAAGRRRSGVRWGDHDSRRPLGRHRACDVERGADQGEGVQRRSRWSRP